MGYMLEKPSYMRAFHKIVSFSTNFLAIRLYQHATDTMAHFLIAAKTTGYVESIGMMAHARGTLYTKPIARFLYLVSFITQSVDLQ